MNDYLHQTKKMIEPSDFRRIHKNCEQAVSQFKDCESQLIRALQEADKYKVYRYLGLNSLFQYALSLGLSEAQSYNYITVARKSIECPELQKALEKKVITISKARTVSGVINEKNQMDWIQIAKTSTKRELERQVAKFSPRAVKKESARFINDHTLELQVTVSEDIVKQLEKVKDLLSQKHRKPVSLEEALEVLSTEYIEKHDPVKKAERARDRKIKASNRRLEKKDPKNNEQVVPGQEIAPMDEQSAPGQQTVLSVEKLALGQQITLLGESPNPAPLQKGKSKQRLKLPSSLIHKINLRDQNQCQFKLKNDQICGQSRWLEIHHKIPVAEGGADQLENLLTLCSEHHHQVHQSRSL